MCSSRFLFLFSFLFFLRSVNCDSHSVQIGIEDFINEVDTRFLSFTIDPKYLFTNTDSFNSQESICMASSLTPAFMRIAGPSTAHMTFYNSTIALNGQETRQISTIEAPDTQNTGDLLLHNLKIGIENVVRKKKREIKKNKKLRVTHRQWKRFIQWANATGFDLVFGLNYDEKTEREMWDPNAALNILSMADKANVGDIYWQLGYECQNRTIEEYLNDLETLRVIVETFKHGELGRWKVISGDVTKCLQADSKSDFKDFVTLSDELMDAIFLNGNSSVQEINRMSERQRRSLLYFLSKSSTPLWMTESTKTEENIKLLEGHIWRTVEEETEEERDTIEDDAKVDRDDLKYQLVRAADWMTSLGYSARNGFSVHFRELEQNELFQPTLSFYMALLFKNLVGTRVLKVSTDAVVFAHCTRLRRSSVPGAVTLYAANLRDTHARYAVRMSKREEGGDIMQFVLGMDKYGNITVNGKVMQYEGNIKPVLKRVRPYKTLLLHLPPKSFGFWALANTNVEACQDKKDDQPQDFVEADNVSDINDAEDDNIREKRSIDDNKVGDLEEINFDLIEHTDEIDNSGLLGTLQALNKDLLNLSKKWLRDDKSNIMILKRPARQLFGKNDENEAKKVIPKRRLKAKDIKKTVQLSETRLGIVEKLKELQGKLYDTRHEIRKKIKLNKTNLNKRHVLRYGENLKAPSNLMRERRSIITDKSNKNKVTFNLNDVENSAVNEIDTDGSKTKMSHLLSKLGKQLDDLPENGKKKYHPHDDIDSDKEQSLLKELADQIKITKKLSDDQSIINFSEKPNHRFIASGIDNLFKVLKDLSSNLGRVWDSLSVVA